MNMDPSDEISGFTPKMALCLAVITLVGIDGEFAKEELEKLRSFIRTDETAFLKAFSFYNDRSPDVCFKIISARLNDEQKQTTYKILSELAHSDLHLAGSEKQLLQRYAAEFELKKDYVDSVNSDKTHKYDLAVFD